MRPLPNSLVPGLAPTALAPMQDVTTLPFMRVIAEFGPPDLFFTEYFRVYQGSKPERHICESLDGIGPQHPIFAQIIGEDIPAIEKTIAVLETHPIAGIDLNLGCPAPKVYRKNVGGGLLRDPARIDEVLGAMRAAIRGRFTVKMRLGFESGEEFEHLLEVISRHEIDLLSVHGRTVRQLYRGEVDYERIAYAKRRMCCPVLANGNVSSPRKALEVLSSTGVDGLMIGRSAIRNPWIFRQIRETLQGLPPVAPCLRDVRAYIDRLAAAYHNPEIPDRLQANFLKKFLNFVGEGIDPDGKFLKEMRRAQSRPELFDICDRWLTEGERADLPFSSEPFQGVLARPNHEGPELPACGL